MELWNFGAGKNCDIFADLDKLREAILRNNPKAEAQTWNEFKIKRSVKAKRKLKDRQSGSLRRDA
jgi:hypothetical protein